MPEPIGNHRMFFTLIPSAVAGWSIGRRRMFSGKGTVNCWLGEASKPSRKYLLQSLFQNVFCFNKRGRASARLLRKEKLTCPTDGRSRPEAGQLSRKEVPYRRHTGWRQVTMFRRTTAGRSPPMATKKKREAIGDRPATRLGTAEKPATLEGQSVAGYRRDRRASDGLALVPRDRRARNPACRG